MRRFTVVGGVTFNDVGYITERGFLGGSEVRLRGLSMIDDTTAAAA
ncbi:hypothetical protein [Rhizorhabdus sp. FW153]